MTQCCDDWGNCTRGPDCPARRPSCDELAVCQDRRPPCKGCKPSEGAVTVQTLLRELGKRQPLPLLPGVK